MDDLGLDDRDLDDLDLLRGLRAGIPTPAQARLVPGRARLLGAIARRTGSRRIRGAFVLAGVAAAATAAVVTAAVTTGGAAPAARSLSPVAELAYRAAAAAERQPAVPPGQWVYRKTIATNPPHTSPRTYTAEIWDTADYAKGASYARGRLWVTPNPKFWFPLEPYRSLGSLPADPRALVRALGRLSGEPNWPIGYAITWTPDAKAFAVIATMLQSYVMPPKFTAELYRALGDIPGVSVDNHAVTVAGQPGIGFRRSFSFLPRFHGGSGSGEIIVSRHTYAYLGQYFPRPHGMTPLGGPDQGSALVRQAYVSGPGTRP